MASSITGSGDSQAADLVPSALPAVSSIPDGCR